MVKFAFAVGLLAAMLPAHAADHAVRGHVKKDGTYVAPSRATNSNEKLIGSIYWAEKIGG